MKRPRTWRRTPAAARRRSTGARRGMRAMRVSQRIRKRIEEAFGWIKTVAGQERDQVPRPRPRRMGLHLRGRRLQSGASAETSGGLGVKAPANCRLIGRWRIVEADLWDRAYLDLVRPADAERSLTRRGEIAFGAARRRP